MDHEVVDEKWSKLASGTEDDVLHKVRIAEKIRANTGAGAGQFQWVNKKVRQEESTAEGREGRSAWLHL